LLPYFSKSLASRVTQSGANCPTSLVQTTLIFAAWTGAAQPTMKSAARRNMKRFSPISISFDERRAAS
jgi:hypothetical protein